MMSKKVLVIIVVLGVVLVVLGFSGAFRGEDDGGGLSGPTYTVAKGPLTISFVESGTIKAREQIVIKNEVEGSTSIISLVPEGSRVQQGDLLIELDASGLEDNRLDQEITVQNAEASYVSAKENLAVVENQAASDVELAKLTLEFAQQDLEKYLQGEYPYALDEADAEITLAEEELVQKRETREWSEKLNADQYLSDTELQSDQLAEKKAALNLELAKKSKALLVEFTKKREVAQLESDVSQATMALERTERSARADVIQAEADLKAKEAEYERKLDRLHKLENQIEKTKIYAPADGLVIYATSARRGGFRGNVEPLEEGQSVREREELIYLPTGNTSKAEISIHETNIKKTRMGMPAVIKVDALPGKVYYGKVQQIAPLPDAQSMWMNPDLKVYNSEIFVDGQDEMLRTGMSCQAEIVVATYEDAYSVPLQAVVRQRGKPVVYVQGDAGFEARVIEVGLDNNKMIHVKAGLRDGDVVLLNPPLKGAGGDGNGNGEASEDELSADEQAVQDKVSQGLSDMEAGGVSVDGGKTGGREATKPSGAGGDGRGAMGEGGAGSMTDEMRKQIREQMEKMTPEERETLRERFRSSGGGRQGGEGGDDGAGGRPTGR